MFYLASDLSKYFSKEELGMTEDVVNEALERYDKLSESFGNDNDDVDELKDILGNMKEKKAMLNNINDMKREAKKLYNEKKISEKSYNEI